MAGESLRSSGRIFVAAMRGAYEHLGMVLFCSFVWFALAFMPTTFSISFARQVPCVLTFLVVFFAVILLASPVTAAVCSVARALVDKEEPGVGELWRRFGVHYWLTVKASAAMLIVLFVLVVDIVFFLSSSIRVVQWIAVPWLYLLLFWMLMTTYIFPLIAHEQVGLFKLLKRAALLALDNLVMTIIVLLEVFLIASVSWLLLFPVIILLGGLLALLLVTALAEVLQKYKEPYDEPEKA